MRCIGGSLSQRALSSASMGQAGGADLHTSPNVRNSRLPSGTVVGRKNLSRNRFGAAQSETAESVKSGKPKAARARDSPDFRFDVSLARPDGRGHSPSKARHCFRSGSKLIALSRSAHEASLCWSSSLVRATIAMPSLSARPSTSSRSSRMVCPLSTARTRPPASRMV